MLAVYIKEMATESLHMTQIE